MLLCWRPFIEGSTAGKSINSFVADEKLPRPGIEPPTFWLKDRCATNFVNELSPLARAVITQANHTNTLLPSAPLNLCLAPKSGHPPLWRILESSRSKLPPCIYHNNSSMALEDSTISGTSVMVVNMPSPGIELTTYWFTYERAINFAKRPITGNSSNYPGQSYKYPTAK